MLKIKKFLLIGLILLLATSAILILKNKPNSIPVTPPLIFYPTDDAYVIERTGYINENFGRKKTLNADFESNVVQSFLKFNIPKLPSSLKGVFLYLTVTTDSGADSKESGTLYNLSNNSWIEETITWDNKPPIDGNYSWKISNESIDLGKTYRVDLSNYLRDFQKGGEFSFAITTDSEDGVGYYSKEAKEGKPKLVFYFSSLPPKMTIFPLIKKISPTTATILWGLEKKFDLQLIFGEKREKLNYKSKPSVTLLPSEKTKLKEDLFLYQAELSGLSPQKTYFYKIKTKERDFFPEGPLKFSTPPLVGQEASLTAVIIGDWGRKSAEKIKNLYQIEKINPDLILTTGDNVSPDGSFLEWISNIFEYINEPLISQIVFYPTPGDHDMKTKFPRRNNDGKISPYEVFFGNPSKPGILYYSFDYGLAHFIILDSNNVESKKMLSWFENDLENNKKTNRWLIVIWHHPFYSCSPKMKVDKVREEFSLPYIKALAENGGGILFHGHHHLYCRSKKITIVNEPDYPDKQIDDIAVSSYKKGANDIISFVTGGGGDELISSLDLNFWPAAFGKRKHHLLALNISPYQLRVTAISPEGEKIDEVIITKEAN